MSVKITKMLDGYEFEGELPDGAEVEHFISFDTDPPGLVAKLKTTDGSASYIAFRRVVEGQ